MAIEKTSGRASDPTGPVPTGAHASGWEIGAILINPGAGPLLDPAGPDQALTNAQAFVQDLIALGNTASVAVLTQPTDLDLALMMGGTKYTTTHDGRYPFRLVVDGHDHLLEMPGLDLEHVRFMENPGQSILDFPRVFLDGSSWTWDIALRVLHENPPQ